MKSTAEIVEILRHFKETRSETYGIERMALFGSAARGEQREGSDIDICVKLRKTTFRLYMSLREELERLFSAKFLYNRDELSEDSNMMLFYYGNTLNER